MWAVSKFVLVTRTMLLFGLDLLQIHLHFLSNGESCFKIERTEWLAFVFDMCESCLVRFLIIPNSWIYAAASVTVLEDSHNSWIIKIMFM